LRIEPSSCYKIVQSGKYVKIKAQLHFIRGAPYVMFIFQDISNQRVLDKQNTDKVQDMLRLAQIVHDLKTPLHCIQMTIKFLRSLMSVDQSEITELFKSMNISFDYVFSMIEDIQDLAKYNDGQKFTLNEEFFDPLRLLEELKEQFLEVFSAKQLKFVTDVKIS
jgi:signal transduction histidine kinase